jgi:hypothetical protein
MRCWAGAETRARCNRRVRKCYQFGLAAVKRSTLADQLIRLSSPQGQTCYPEILGHVRYRDPETGKECVLLTSRLDLPALEVAGLYRRGWQNELFFNWLKQ